MRPATTAHAALALPGQRRRSDIACTVAGRRCRTTEISLSSARKNAPSKCGTERPSVSARSEKPSTIAPVGEDDERGVRSRSSRGGAAARAVGRARPRARSPRGRARARRSRAPRGGATCRAAPRRRRADAPRGAARGRRRPRRPTADRTRRPRRRRRPPLRAPWRAPGARRRARCGPRTAAPRSRSRRRAESRPRAGDRRPAAPSDSARSVSSGRPPRCTRAPRSSSASARRTSRCRQGGGHGSFSSFCSPRLSSGYRRGMRFLHTMLRVGDLDASIRFYTEQLGMKLLRRSDYPEGKFTLAFVGYGDESDHTVLELTYNWGRDALRARRRVRPPRARRRPTSTPPASACARRA